MVIDLDSLFVPPMLIQIALKEIIFVFQNGARKDDNDIYKRNLAQIKKKIAHLDKINIYKVISSYIRKPFLLCIYLWL